MCTLSIVGGRNGDGLRVVMNRDERRLRPAARPPIRTRAGETEAVWPVDPQGGGTWIAATDAGLVLALLNASHPEDPVGADRPSRGLVIPALASARDLDDVEALWSRMNHGIYAPFRLVVVSGAGGRLFDRGHRQSTPFNPIASTFSSSDLGDYHVEQRRRTLFERIAATEPDPWRAQDRFHQHAWPDRRHLSVLMSRSDACTVSRTEVRLMSGGAEMRYSPIVEGWPAGVAARALSLTAGRAVNAA